ncbi:alpha/beta hydrolase [Sphingomonas sp. JC676]|uniref:alpha/beta fold hydrolase n=1 Tax=Sphingomonas sp. JC676 TaxID=2768065 RepID=UPI0016582BF1|nr:alpha/beta hydrolase [Sphingomonas sp. JC676]MBC9034663.1 alpha/beta hydrolase [Sphingomonas sp. JC676]
MLIPLGIVGIAIAALAGWSAYVGRKVEEAVPPDGSFADVAGARLHFLDMRPENEKGPPIVMLHGLMGQMRNFSHSLAGRLAMDHRVILIDRPGWGYSKLTGPRAGVAEQAAMIAALIGQLGLEKPLLVGHSMGGAVSLALALDHPELVRGLALIAPYTQPVDQPPDVFKGLVVPRGLRGPLAWTIAVPIAMRTGKLRSTQAFAPDSVPSDFGTRGGGVLTVRPTSFLQGTFEIGIGKTEMERLTPRYGEIKVPVAILYGRQDALLDPALHGTKTAEAIPGGTIEMIYGGHMLPVAHAAETEAWLRKVLAA